MPEIARLNALHLSHDGPIDPSALAAISFPTVNGWQLCLAEAGIRDMRRWTRRQIGIIRARRADGSLTPGHLADLACYRRTYRAWQLQARVLRAIVRGEEIVAGCRDRVAEGGMTARELMGAL